MLASTPFHQALQLPSLNLSSSRSLGWQQRLAQTYIPCKCTGTPGKIDEWYRFERVNEVTFDAYSVRPATVGAVIFFLVASYHIG